MSQQLNLLTAERHGINPSFVALGSWGLVLLVLFAAWGVNQSRISSALEAEAVAAKELTDARALISRREDQKKSLLVELDAARPLAESARQLLTLADGLGNPGGYAEHFAAIAAVTGAGLWLTDIDIDRAGKSIKVEGLSLGNDAIMRFGHDLNAALAERGVKFVSLEISPQTVSAGAPGAGSGMATAGGVAPLAVTKFVFK